MAAIEFTSRNTFRSDGRTVEKPGTIQSGSIVQVFGYKGEYKILNKRMEKGTLTFDAEKVPEHMFKVKHKSLGIIPVHAKSDDRGTTEYLVEHKGKLRWVKRINTVPA
jgi:hypothetical protein